MKGGRSSGAFALRSAEALVLAAAGVALAHPALAAPPESTEARRLRHQKEDAARPAIGFNWSGTWLTPFAAPAYSPELGVFLTAGGLLSWRSDQDSRRSGLAMSGGYGTVGAV